MVSFSSTRSSSYPTLWSLKRMSVILRMPSVWECNCATACVQRSRMHISKGRQLLGLLNFCLLSGAESEMERIDLLSTGGALPWAGPLACSLAWLPCRGLSFSNPPHPHPPPPLSLTISLFSFPLCVAAASPPADTCPAVTGRDVRWAVDTKIDLPPFPHKLHIKLLETLEETKNGRRERRENIVNSHHLFKLTMFGAAKEWRTQGGQFYLWGKVHSSYSIVAQRNPTTTRFSNSTNSR